MPDTVVGLFPLLVHTQTFILASFFTQNFFLKKLKEEREKR